LERLLVFPGPHFPLLLPVLRQQVAFKWLVLLRNRSSTSSTSNHKLLRRCREDSRLKCNRKSSGGNTPRPRPRQGQRQGLHRPGLPRARTHRGPPLFMARQVSRQRLRRRRRRLKPARCPLFLLHTKGSRRKPRLCSPLLQQGTRCQGGKLAWPWRPPAPVATWVATWAATLPRRRRRRTSSTRHSSRCTHLSNSSSTCKCRHSSRRLSSLAGLIRRGTSR